MPVMMKLMRSSARWVTWGSVDVFIVFNSQGLGEWKGEGIGDMVCCVSSINHVCFRV